MNKIILIDPGHGGLIEGDYMTEGKQATFEKSTIYEGVLNRGVANWLNLELSIRNIKSEIITPENTDVPLTERIERVNTKVTKNPDSKYFLLSIHHNASENATAKGFECFTSRGETDSDMFADRLMNLFIEKHPKRKARHELLAGQIIAKEANFRILKETKCPAVLTEFCFMTNKDEFEYMTRYSGIMDEVNLFVDWIVNYVNR